MSHPNKLVLLGDASVGKTCIVKNWLTSTFNERQMPTIGAAFIRSVFTFENQEQEIQIWDTAGEEQYRSVTSMYIRDAFAALIVFDRTRKSTLDSIPYWLNLLNELQNVSVIVCGNKTDLLDEIEVSDSDAVSVCSRLGLNYYKTSAKTGFGIKDAVDDVLEMAFRAKKAREQVRPAEPKVVNIAPEKNQKQNCCINL